MPRDRLAGQKTLSPGARLSVPVLRYDHNKLLEFESVAVAMVVVVSMISSFDVYVCIPI